MAVDDDFAERHSGLVEQIHTELERRYGIAPDGLYDAESNADGPRVVLTLDERLQQTAEEAGSGAGVVAIEPGSGAVLCYFGAEEETGVDQVGDDAPHPPSSVFDMVTAAAALENGATTASEWSDGPDQEVTLETAVRESRKDAVAEIASNSVPRPWSIPPPHSASATWATGTAPSTTWRAARSTTTRSRPTDSAATP
ncbi:hypothetical protein GCM10029992_56330 [Glycomyces albus]